MSDEENKGTPPPSRNSASSDGEETSKNSETSIASLHVGNLKYETTEDTLEKVFGEIGPVVKVELIKKDDGTSKGYAFVDMENKDDAQAAIDKLNKKDLDGRLITVAFKKTREELQNDRIRNRSSRAPFYDRNQDRGRRSSRYYRDDRDDRYYDDRYSSHRYRDSRRSDRRDHYHDYDHDRHRRRSFDYEYDMPRRKRSRSPSRGSRRNYSDSD